MPGIWRKNWKEVLPPMPTKRNLPAAITTHNHLVVAGGWINYHVGLSEVEVLNLETQQWHIAKSLPQVASCPQLVLCGKQLYTSCHNSVHSCSFEELLGSCFSSDDKKVWTRLTDTPHYDVAIVSLEERVLAIGGSDERDGNPTDAIYCYDNNKNQWDDNGKIPSSVSRVLCTVIAGNKVIIAGGRCRHNVGTNDTYVGILLDGAVLVS